MFKDCVSLKKENIIINDDRIYQQFKKDLNLDICKIF